MTGELAEAVVDLAAVAGNVERIAGATTAAVMAVVKADGFGHGALPVARAAPGGGAGWLGVTSAAEALELRSAGLTAPVLSWLHGPGTDFATADSSPFDVTAQTAAFAEAVAYARDAGLDPELLHLANSAAAFTAPQTHSASLVIAIMSSKAAKDAKYHQALLAEAAAHVVATLTPARMVTAG